MQNPSRASAILLMSAVSADIMQEIVGNPFFAFSGKAKGHGKFLQEKHRIVARSFLALVGSGECS